jgi:ABC-type uncharacterized transport system ATPase subunit
MTQKLGLAANLLFARDLYILDEPMSGLDPASRIAVKSVLARIASRGPNDLLHFPRTRRRERARVRTHRARSRHGAV